MADLKTIASGYIAASKSVVCIIITYCHFKDTVCLSYCCNISALLGMAVLKLL
jgi:hypothetical protein